MRVIKAWEVNKLDIIVHNGEPFGVMNFDYCRLDNDMFITFIDSSEKILVKDMEDVVEVI